MDAGGVSVIVMGNKKTRKKRTTKLDERRSFAHAKEIQKRNKEAFDNSYFGQLKIKNNANSR